MKARTDFVELYDNEVTLSAKVALFCFGALLIIGLVIFTAQIFNINLNW